MGAENDSIPTVMTHFPRSKEHDIAGRVLVPCVGEEGMFQRGNGGMIGGEERDLSAR